MNKFKFLGEDPKKKKAKKIIDLLKQLLLISTFITITSLFFFGSKYLNKRQSFAYKARKILASNKGEIKRILFAPDDNIQNILIGLIEEEKEKILIAIFLFTNGSIAKALINAKKRGVKIEIVADGQSSLYKYSTIKLLKKANIPIWLYPNQTEKERIGILHHKFIIFSNSILNKSILATGSYNFTKSANNKNQENIIITDDLEIIEAYKKQFEILKERCIKITNKNI